VAAYPFEMPHICLPWIVSRRRAAHGDGCDMNLYRSLGNSFGTVEALELAHRLAVWHDAMVMHQRRTHGRLSARCEPGCPHVEAASLWLEALDAYGERAHGLGFLRTHGGPSVPNSRNQFRQMEA
jgi:hypothetical protein